MQLQTVFFLVAAIVGSAFLSDAASQQCSQNRSLGYGNRNQLRYYYDSRSNACRQFSYKGSGGNSNRFTTLATCQRSCVSSQKYRTTARWVFYLEFLAECVFESIAISSSPTTRRYKPTTTAASRRRTTTKNFRRGWSYRLWFSKFWFRIIVHNKILT